MFGKRSDVAIGFIAQRQAAPLGFELCGARALFGKEHLETDWPNVSFAKLGFQCLSRAKHGLRYLIFVERGTCAGHTGK